MEENAEERETIKIKLKEEEENNLIYRKLANSSKRVLKRCNDD